jgi:hypothetical protein
MANPTRSKAKQGRGAARAIRVPGRLLEAAGNRGPREMIRLRQRRQNSAYSLPVVVFRRP